MPEERKTDLSTLGGISQAREDLYIKVMTGKVEQGAASICERILRGQGYIHGDLKLKYIAMLAKYNLADVKDDHPAKATVLSLHRFIEGSS